MTERATSSATQDDGPPRSNPLGRLLESQLVRFVAVGVVNSAFGFGLFALLQLTLGHVVHYLVILTVAQVVSILEAYVLQRWLVFRVRGRWWRELVRFSSVYAVSFAINLVVLPLLVEVAHLPVLLSQAMVMVGTALGSFVAHRSFTFRRPAVATDVPGSPAPGGDS
ncbi:GtrA family protein [Cellulomonas soli]|uniref:GtrA family protein n=1 Tax=Cellulomonas soli TaxID=931535 RepID=UPI0011BFB00E|nr:GtrA family protein [Cellulomonas soli]NYI57582.1 putative flippase GtrA [Cellulomonas soli]